MLLFPLKPIQKNSKYICNRCLSLLFYILFRPSSGIMYPYIFIVLANGRKCDRLNYLVLTGKPINHNYRLGCDGWAAKLLGSLGSELLACFLSLSLSLSRPFSHPLVCAELGPALPIPACITNQLRMVHLLATPLHSIIRQQSIFQ